MLVSRKFEIMSPVPPTMQKPSEIYKRVLAGMAGYLIGGRYDSASQRKIYNTPNQDWASVR